MAEDPFFKFLSSVTDKIKIEKEHKTLMEKVNSSNDLEPANDPLQAAIDILKKKINEESASGTEVKAEQQLTIVPALSVTEQAKTIEHADVTKEKDNFSDFVFKLKDIISGKKSQSSEPVPEITSEESNEKVVTKDVTNEKEQDKNEYVEILDQLSDEKVTDQQPEKVSEIKKLIEQYAEKYFKKAAIMSEYAGGGGTNAVQYANGGTMNGDLNVNGNYLSGGINLLDIFSGGGGGDPAVNAVVYANSGNWDSNYTTTNANSANWSQAFTNLTSNSAAYLSGVDISLLAAASGSWNSNYTTTNANSANWQTGYNNALYTINGTANQIVATPAGSNTGNNSVTLSLPTNLIVPNNLTVQGNLTALGSSTFKNTIFTTTSALSVYNTGPGPALFVYQAAGPYDVASFYDGDGIEVLHVGNAQPGGRGFVGINESFPGAELTVNGAISSNGYITVSGGNSNQWNSNYTTTNANSAAWSNWSTVSATYALGSQYVKLSGDTMTGPLSTPALSTNNIFLAGNTLITAPSAPNNVFIGDGTTGEITTTGTHNFIFGQKAGCVNTTGSNNIFMGYCVGCRNTSGGNNNFLGRASGQYNTTGSHNNFFGSRAGYRNTTGQHNTFIGYTAGFLAQTGRYNTIIGKNSGRYTIGFYNNIIGTCTGTTNTTGRENIFIGSRVGNNNTTGFNNIFMGLSAGDRNIIGSDNIIMGRTATVATSALSGTIVLGTGAMATQTNQIVLSGGFSSIRTLSGILVGPNVFIGDSSTGNDNATGDTNFVFGISAGNVLTTGGNNTFIGRSTGRRTTTGNNNVFIGYNAGNSNTTGYQNIAIGRAGQSAGGGNFKFNVFLGQYAGNISDGFSNVMIGRQAGINTFGGSSNNIFLGTFAGRSASTSSNNVSIGSYAGQNATSTQFNNFIGARAGSYQTTGVCNNFIGGFAGCTNTVGSNNLIIGHRANTASNNLSGVVAIGLSAVATASNTLVIGAAVAPLTGTLFGSLAVTSTTLPALCTISGNSDQWNSNYTTTNSNSAAWSNWQSVSANYAQGSQYVKLSGDNMTGLLTNNTGISSFSLSARFIDLIHSPANDGINPVLRFGEYDTTGGNAGFSGMYMSYDETANTFGISANFDPAAGIPAISIDRNAVVGARTLVAGPAFNAFSTAALLSTVSGMYVDAVSGYAGFYTNAPIAPVDVRGTMKFAASAAAATTTSNIKIQGNYAYVTNYDDASLMSFDLTQTTLVSAASASTGSANPQGLYVSGKYAYVVTANTSSSVFQIFDISNPSSFVLLSTSTIGVGQNAFDVVVQGNYAFILTNSNFTAGYIVAYDISNPYAPVKIFATQVTSNGGSTCLIIQGKYLYWAAGALGSARLFRMDVSDPRKIPAAETVASSFGGFNGVAVRGKYIYAYFNGNFWVSDGTTSTTLALPGIFAVTNYCNIVLQGNYAYVTNVGYLHKVDVSAPLSPRLIQSLPIASGVSLSPCNFAIQGRYAYLADRANSRINVVDLGGAYVQQLQAGGVRTDSLDVVRNTVMGNDLDVAGGAAFGQGFRAYKDSSVLGSLYVTTLTSSSASNYFSVASGNNVTLFTVTSTGNVGIGTVVPGAKLTVVGTLSTTDIVTLGNSSANSTLQITGYANKGGTGYHDFASVTNTYGSAVTPNKFFRLNSNGGLEIINSAYSASLLQITDDGAINVYGTGTAKVANNDALSGYIGFGNNNTQIYDDGNTHIHARGSGNGMWINTNNGQLNLLAQSPVNGGAVGTGVAIGSSTLNGYVSINSSRNAAIAQPYGYLNSSGASTTTGTTPNPYSLTCSSRIQSPEFNASSDERLKDNIVPITLEDATNFVKCVSAVTFNWKDAENPGKKSGFIAQQVMRAGFDHLISIVGNANVQEQIDADGFVSPASAALVMNYDQAIPYHGTVIKNLLERIEQLEAQIKKLK